MQLDLLRDSCLAVFSTLNRLSCAQNRACTVSRYGGVVTLLARAEDTVCHMVCYTARLKTKVV